jgi:hypothetical protein
VSPAILPANLSANLPANILLRLLGADPEAFHPLYRVQKLLLARSIRAFRKSRVSTFGVLCLYAFVYGMAACSFLMAAKSRLLGSAVAITVGGMFLLLNVVTDHFDVLVNPREILVLAAHPHDGRSFLLAKIAAIGRFLGILAVILFIPPGIAAGFLWRSWGASFAFLAGAAGAGVAVCLCGLFLAAVLLRLGGRSAMDRLLPWVQGAFQLGYIFLLGGPRLMTTWIGRPSSELGILPWVLPPFWFLAPLEMLDHGIGSAVLARLGLAVGTLAVLLLGATRWLGGDLSERLLEPARSAAPRRSAGRRPSRGGGERARLFSILRIHLRSDWRIRSEFLLIPLMGAFYILFYFRGNFGAPASHGLSTFIYCWMLVLSVDVLTRSSRPESLWWILTAPIDRGRFSFASVWLVRAFQLAPLYAAVAIVEIRAGGSWPYRLALLLELLALGDLLVVLGKGLFPDFPFSRARLVGRGGSNRLVLTLLGSFVSGIATALVFGFGVFAAPGALAGAALFALLHIPATLWARRRAAAAAEGLELVMTVS